MARAAAAGGFKWRRAPIAAERLELTRVLPRSALSMALFAVTRGCWWRVRWCR